MTLRQIRSQLRLFIGHRTDNFLLFYLISLKTVAGVDHTTLRMLSKHVGMPAGKNSVKTQREMPFASAACSC
jgi:hypothetical protein